ncbi:MAG: hypothetical protein ACREE9_20630 [Stellaceae bacterium]
MFRGWPPARESQDFLDGFGRIGHHRGALLDRKFSQLISGFPMSGVDEILLVLAP